MRILLFLSEVEGKVREQARVLGAAGKATAVTHNYTYRINLSFRPPSASCPCTATKSPASYRSTVCPGLLSARTRERQADTVGATAAARNKA